MRPKALVVALVVLLLAACGGNKDATAPVKNEVRLYGSDGNMLNAVGDLLATEHPDALLGMKGTTPLPRLTQGFRDRLLSVDPQLKDEAFAAEAYDAVIISALATQLAKTTNPKAIAAQINGVTTGGTLCDTTATCLALAASGKDIEYRGISLGLGGFTDAGEPSAATFGILRFAARNHLDASQTEYVPAGDPSKTTDQRPPAPGPAGTGAAAGPLKIGALLPHTGDLSSAGPPMFAGALLAIREINAAGGVLGKPVTWLDGDDHTDAEQAKATAQALISSGANVIIGAGASSITKAVLPVTMAAGVVLFSPCNTAAELSTVADNGLYFRTAPPDDLQAAALTDIIMRDGVRKVVIVARKDAYGQGLMDAVQQNLVQAGIPADAIKTIPYEATNPDFSKLGGQIKDFAPDGVLIVGFDETAKAIGSIIRAGIASRSI
jgi:ABC-type branched-subunit amino acid transport system substrate-binding protein